jgi:hypothetical protein
MYSLDGVGEGVGGGEKKFDLNLEPGNRDHGPAMVPKAKSRMAQTPPARAYVRLLRRTDHLRRCIRDVLFFFMGTSLLT